MAEEYPTQELSSTPEPPKVWLWLKNFFIFLALLAIVVGSFWLSFQLGKRILVPVKRPKIEVSIPEPPPSLKALEQLQKALSPEAVTKKEEIKKEEVIKKVAQPVLRKKGKGRYYKVQAGWFKDKIAAEGLAERLRNSGFEVYVKKVFGGWRVQVGAFVRKSSADLQKRKLIDQGFKALIILE
ncbi:MAG: SPOR domain-containing protein [Candidatus Margulisiibacteriota bacterium]